MTVVRGICPDVLHGRSPSLACHSLWSSFLSRVRRPRCSLHSSTHTNTSSSASQRKRGGFHPVTTLFCAFDITDLYSMVSQEESFDALVEFLVRFGHKKVKGVPIHAIQKLARIVIQENVFT